MDLHLVLDRSQPLRAQLEQQVRDGIRRGRLRPGTRLPPSRLLAEELGISRGVVVEAYAQLTAEGYLLTRGSGGTRVAATIAPVPPSAAQPRPRRRFDLRAGLPDPALFPRRAWSAASTVVARDLPDAALLYGPAQGQRGLRRALLGYLGRVRAVVAEEDQTLITCGASHAFALLWSALRASGARRVAHEDPAWERIPATIAHAQLDPVPVRVDAHGLSVAELYASDAQAVVVSPAHQYPTGVIMHPARRAQLIRWARETGGLIVEDDYDAEYRFGSRPIAPLRSFAPDNVAYVGTTSKILAPALRLGWLLVPPALAEAVSAEHAVSQTQPSVLNQAAFATLLEEGDIDRHLRRTRRTYRQRRSALMSALQTFIPSLRVTGGAAGLHLMGWLPRGMSESELVAEAGLQGIGLDGLHTACRVARELGPVLVLGYGAINADAIAPAISRMAELEAWRAQDGN